MYDEMKGKADVKALSREGRAYLSHVIRNGMCNILSAHCMEMDVQEEIHALERKIEEVGL